MTAVSIEELLAKSGPANERAAALMVVTLDEAAVIGIFPYGKPRARRAPGLENHGIGFGLRSDAFEKIEYQCVDRIGQRSLRGCVGGIASRRVARRLPSKSYRSSPGGNKVLRTGPRSART